MPSRERPTTAADDLHVGSVLPFKVCTVGVLLQGETDAAPSLGTIHR
jgi:hypothetical protein